MPETPQTPYDMLVERIIERAEALHRFAQAYLDTAEDDTSREERRKLAEVNDLLDQAMDRRS